MLRMRGSITVSPDTGKFNPVSLMQMEMIIWKTCFVKILVWRVKDFLLYRHFYQIAGRHRRVRTTEAVGTDVCH